MLANVQPKVLRPENSHIFCKFYYWNSVLMDCTFEYAKQLSKENFSRTEFLCQGYFICVLLFKGFSVVCFVCVTLWFHS